MATDAELLALYGQLRSHLLSRHWLTMRYFPSYTVSDFNWIGTQQTGAEAGVPSSHLLNPPSNDTVDAALALNPDSAERVRWTVGNHEHENPMIHTGSVLSCLAVEDALGSSESRIAVRLTLNTLEQLFKFKDRNDPFAGWMVRWDAVGSDNWVLDQQGKPKQCRDFLTTPEGTYQYSAPLDSQLLRNAEDQGFDKIAFRHHEPSKDELIGILPGYRLVQLLVNDAAIRATVQEQAGRLGDYLAHVNYVLVRPNGDFSARGASGFLPGLVLPLRTAIRAISGVDASPTGSFEDSLEEAGVLVQLKDKLNAWGAVGALAGAAGSIGVLALPGWVLGRAACLWANKRVFRVKESEQIEFVLAYLLSMLPDTVSFATVMAALTVPGLSFATNGSDFPARWTLAALDAGGVAGTAINAAYISWLGARALPGAALHGLAEAHANASTDGGKPNGEAGHGAGSAISWAVGMLIGMPGAEVVVAQSLQRLHAAITASPRWNGDLNLLIGGDAGHPNLSEGVEIELEFMLTLALSWLQQQRRQQAGQPLSSRLPTPPNFASNPLPVITVPPSITAVAAAGGDEVIIPADVVNAATNGVGELGDAGALNSGAATRPSDVTSDPSPVSEIVVTAFADDSWSHSNSDLVLAVLPPPGPRPDGAVPNIEPGAFGPNTNQKSIDFAMALIPQQDAQSGDWFVQIDPFVQLPVQIQDPNSMVIAVSVTSGVPNTYKGKYERTWTYSWTLSASP